MRRASSFLLLLVVACGTAQSTRPASIPQPDLDAHLVSPLFFGSGTTAPATIEVEVTNRADVPIEVIRVALDSPGMGQYTLGAARRDFKETLAPHESKKLTVFATAYAQTTRRPDEPLVIRAIVEFKAGTTYWREILMARE